MPEIGQASFQQVDVASASTIDLSAVTQRKVRITGTTNINTITMKANQELLLTFAGILTLASGIGNLPNGSSSITTAAGDTCVLTADASAVVTMWYYQRKSGAALSGTASFTTLSASGTATFGAGSTTQMSVASTGVTTIRNDNAGVTGTIIQENFGITAVDQGTTLTVRFGAGGVLGAIAATWQILATEDWSVSANRSSKIRFNIRIDDAATTELDIVNGITVRPLNAIPAGGANTLGLKATSTANFGVFFGSGVPTLSAAKGSLYLRSDGSATNNRAYINTDGATTWTALTTAA